MNIRIITVFVLAGFLTNCAPHEAQNTPSPTAPSVESDEPRDGSAETDEDPIEEVVLGGTPELQGQWQSSCVEAGVSSLTAPVTFGITQASTLRIYGDTFTEINRVTSGSCTGADIEITSTGVYSTETDERAEGSVVDFEVLSYRVKPITEFGMRVLTLGKWCGISDWMIGMERDVSANIGKVRCFPAARVYNVYALSGDKLTFGLGEQLAISSGDRPKKLNPYFFFTRQ